MYEVRVPKLNNNDDTYLILQWHADDGATVRVNDPIVSIETSKAVEELAAAEEGILRQLQAEAAECTPGDLIATIAAATEPVTAAVTVTNQPGGPASEPASEPRQPSGRPTLTEAAAEFAEVHEISGESIAGLGRRVIRVKDLESLLGDDSLAAKTSSATVSTGGGAARRPRLRGQDGVARTVTAAAQIPAAYSLAHLEAENFLAMTRELAAAGRAMPSTLDVVLKIVAGLYDRHPALFVDADPQIGDDAIGVTIDAGNGLFIPVIRDAGRLPLAEIGATLTGYGRAARGAGFAADQLRGARISVSVTAYSGIVFTVPLIHPDQVAMLSMGMLTSRLVLSSGVPRESAVLPLGISYDHRVVNGRDAILFLRAIGLRFADRGWLSELAAGQPTATSPAGANRPIESRQT